MSEFMNLVPLKLKLFSSYVIFSTLCLVLLATSKGMAYDVFDPNSQLSAFNSQITSMGGDEVDSLVLKVKSLGRTLSDVNTSQDLRASIFKAFQNAVLNRSVSPYVQTACAEEIKRAFYAKTVDQLAMHEFLIGTLNYFRSLKAESQKKVSVYQLVQVLKDMPYAGTEEAWRLRALSSVPVQEDSTARVIADRVLASYLYVTKIDIAGQYSLIASIDSLLKRQSQSDNFEGPILIRDSLDKISWLNPGNVEVAKYKTQMLDKHFALLRCEDLIVN